MFADDAASAATGHHPRWRRRATQATRPGVRSSGALLLWDAHRGVFASPAGASRRFGLFDGLKKRLEEVVEADEELKKSVEELKKTKVGDKTVAEAAADMSRKAAEAAKQTADKAQQAADAAKQRAQQARERGEELREEASEGSLGDQARVLREQAARVKEEASRRAEEARAAAEEAKRRVDERLDDSEFVQDAKAKAESATKTVKESKFRKSLSGFADVMGQVFGAKKKRPAQLMDYPWTEYLDNKGKVAYYNKLTHDVTHDKPADFDERGGLSVVNEQSDRTDIAIVQKEQSAWEKVNHTLRNTPIISSVYGAAEAVATSKPVKAARTKIQDKKEEVQEKWETSQNPWVYRTSYVVDSMFTESEEAQAIRGIRRLDPGFSMPEFVDDMTEEIVPTIVGAYLNADRKILEYWLSDDAFARINAALKARDVANLVVDPTLLEVSSVEVVGSKVPDRGEPMMICQVMCQQINCTRNRDGEIVEGAENEIRAVIYAFVMQKVYHERRNEITWQVAELGILGTQLYL